MSDLTIEAGGIEAATAPNKAPFKAWYSLAVLTIVTLIAFVDRNILVLQAEVIRKAMDISDVQLGLLQGTAAATFAALAAFPIAWLADRFDRRIVLAGCALFWSAAVIGCGMAQTYEQLLLASALVGAGEAGLVPISYAIIPEIFGEKQRPLANSVFAMASMTVTSAALALCGQVIGMVEGLRIHLPSAMADMSAWRLGFFAVALPAPFLIALIATISSRRQSGAKEVGPSAAAMLAEVKAAVIPHVKAHRKTFSYFASALFFAFFGFGAIGSWLAVIYLRVYGLDAKQLGTMMGGVSLLAMLVGLPLSIYAMRFFRARIGVRVNVRAMWVNTATAIVAVALMTLATSAYQMIGIHTGYLLMLISAAMVFPTTIQALAPGPMRARVVAVLGMIVAAGGAIAPPITGFVSDHLKSYPNGLMLAVAMVSIPALAVATLLFMKGERHYVVTAEAVKKIDESLA